jgi:ribonuclease Z
MDLSLFFAGTGGAVPSARRGLPALVISCGGDRLLFDCGEGTQRQLVRSIGLVDLDSVFITHFHADHWLGLPGMLKTFALQGRSRPLAVYGPAGLERLMTAMQIVYGRRLPYQLHIRELERWQEVDHDGYLVAAVPVMHGELPAFGYSLVEASRPGRFDPDEARRLGVTDVKDFYRLQHGETVNGVLPEQVMGPPRAGRKIVLSGDTVPCDALAMAAHEADVLVHEATFTADALAESDADTAALRSHSTARQAAELARDAAVRLLAVTHVSGRYAREEVRDEAQSVFAATEAPRDFDTIEVPFPERGGAALVRWSERQARARQRADAAVASPEAVASP